ncbi:MAG: hypothetical protein AB1733_23090 [Thermodesulfobacteriota bacterium]
MTVNAIRNERGAAIAIVLLILGLVSLIAAGLLVQRKFDNYFNLAQLNYERLFNLADGAASLAFTQIGLKESVAYGGGTSRWRVYDGEQKNIGDWDSWMTLKGYETDPQMLKGWELGTAEGYHVQFWVAEGTGKRDVNLRPFKTEAEKTQFFNISALPDLAVFIAANKFARNL